MSPSPTTPKKPPHAGADNHNQPIADPLAHFLALPWAAKLLRDPAATNITVSDRTPLASRDKRFVREILNTHDTVRACVTWLRPVVAKTGGDNMRDMRPISKSAGLLSGGGRENGEEEWERPFLLFNVLLDLGEGLCGFRGTMHGGAVGPVLDEVMCAAADSQSSESFSGEGGIAGLMLTGSGVMGEQTTLLRLP